MPSSSLQPRDSDGMSSPDALADSSTDRVPVATRSPSPSKRRLSTPAKSERSNRDRRSVSTPLSVSSFAAYPISPSRTVTEQTLSPWKIRVTVEAEHEGDEEPGQTMTRTMKVPLRGNSSPMHTEATSETITSRGRRSTPTTVKIKRNGTPVRRRSGSRTRNRRPSVTDLNIAPLGDDGDSDEWTMKKRSPRKKNGSRSRRAQSEQSDGVAQVRDEEAVVVSSNHMSQTSQKSEDECFSIHEDADLSLEAPVEVDSNSNSPELRQIDLNRVSVRPRSQSMKRKDGPIDRADSSDGKCATHPQSGISLNTIRKASANSAASYPTPSPTSSYHHSDELSKDAEPAQQHETLDTMLESEGFTMIDLDSIPSARQFLSSPQDQITKSDMASKLQPNDAATDFGTPRPKPLPLQTSHKKPTPIPSYLTLADDESELSSNVPSSPPVPSKGMLNVPTQNLRNFDRKVTPQTYSSPSLPPPPQRTQKGSPMQVSPDSLPSEVLNAGLALQNAVSSPNDSNEQSAQSIRSRTSSSQPADAFDGFSSGTKRELRAGLRFGEELAKRQGPSPLSSGAAIKKAAPAVVDSGDNVNLSIYQSQLTTQLWRGETSVRHSPFAADVNTQTQENNHNHEPNGRKQDGLFLSSDPTSARRSSRNASSNTPMPKILLTEVDTAQLHTSARNRHVWQLERKAVSHEIENASPSEVVVINSDSENEANGVGESAARLGHENSSPGAKESSRRRENSKRTEAVGRPDGSGAQETNAQTKCAPNGSTAPVVEAGEEQKVRPKEHLFASPDAAPEHSDDEEDIWLQTAKDSSSSPPQNTASSNDLFTRTEQRRQAKRAAEVLNKPRRSLIPSPWKQGQDITESSTFMSNGDMSGLLWQEGVKADILKFGAGEIARQKQHHQRVERKGFLDLTRMLESPVRRAVAGEERVLRKTEDAEQVEFDKHQDKEEAEKAPQSDPSDNSESVEELEEEFAANYSPSSTSSIPTPRVQKVPVNFNDSTLSTSELTTAGGHMAITTPSPSHSPPRQGRPHSARATGHSLTPPRSAMKGGRLSYSPVKINGERPEGDDIGGRRVVFSERSMYLNEEGEESSMSAILDSPAVEGEAGVSGGVLNCDEAVELEEKGDGKRDRGSWLGWMLRGKSSDESQVESEEVSGGVVGQPEGAPVAKYDGTTEGEVAGRADENDEENEESGRWEAAKTSLPTTHKKRNTEYRQSNSSKSQNSAPPQRQWTTQPTQKSTHPSNPPSRPLSTTNTRPTQNPRPTKFPSEPTPRLPSYLLPPSYPSLPSRDPSAPLALSGDFTNTHFRTLHIIHAKSLRPRFHAPRELREGVKKLVREGWTLTKDESSSGGRGGDGKGVDLGVFEWTVGRKEGEVIERFMQEVELGHGVFPGQGDGAGAGAGETGEQGGGRNEVTWGWSVEFLAEKLAMIVIGEEVRREEGKPL